MILYGDTPSSNPESSSHRANGASESWRPSNHIRLPEKPSQKSDGASDTLPLIPPVKGRAQSYAVAKAWAWAVASSPRLIS